MRKTSLALQEMQALSKNEMKNVLGGGKGGSSCYNYCLTEPNGPGAGCDPGWWCDLVVCSTDPSLYHTKCQLHL